MYMMMYLLDTSSKRQNIVTIRCMGLTTNLRTTMTSVEYTSKKDWIHQHPFRQLDSTVMNHSARTGEEKDATWTSRYHCLDGVLLSIID